MADTNTLNNEQQSAAQQAADLWKNLQLPTLNSGQYNPYSSFYTNAGFYNPQLYNSQFSAVGGPQVAQYDASVSSPYSIQNTTGDLQGNQRALIQALTNYGLSGNNTQNQALIQQGLQAQNQAFGNNIQTILAAQRAQGQGGAGATLAAQLAATQGAANTGNAYTSQALNNAIQQQLNALGTAGQLSNAQQGQENNLATAQAQLMNNFNNNVMALRTQANAQNAAAQNAANMAVFNNNQNVANANTAIGLKNTDLQNAAQQSNLSNLQNISNANVGIRNTNTDIANANLGRANTAAEQGYQNAVQQVTGQGNALNNMANLYGAQSAAQAQQNAASTANAINMATLGAGILKNGSDIVKGAGSIGSSLGDAFNSIFG